MPSAEPAPVTLRYWAAARQAAGSEQDTFLGVRTLADLLDRAREAHANPVLDQVLARCSFLVDAEPAGRRAHNEVILSPGAQVEALPPFAGG